MAVWAGMISMMSCGLKVRQPCLPLFGPLHYRRAHWHAIVVVLLFLLLLLLLLVVVVVFLLMVLQRMLLNPPLLLLVRLRASSQVGNSPSMLTIASLGDNVGSLGGGLPLIVNVVGAGVAAAGLDLASVSVSVGGLPCPLTGYSAGSDATTAQVTCRTPAATPGMAVAEYWNMGSPGTAPATFVPFEALYGPPGASQQRA